MLTNLKKVRFDFQLHLSLRLSHTNQSKMASRLSYLTPFGSVIFVGSFSKLLQSFKSIFVFIVPVKSLVENVHILP